MNDAVTKLPPSENKLYYPALDGLRGIAVLMVFFQHYIGVYFRPLSWGWTGVDFFFVLSGFLITGILYDTRFKPHRVRTFYVRRTLRIFPLYYAILLLCLLSTPIFHWEWPRSWYLWPFYLTNYARFLYLPTFLHGGFALDDLYSALPLHPPFFLQLQHFWTLCIEEQFYLIWPLVVFKIRDRRLLLRICLAASVVCLAARLLCVYTLPADYLAVGFVSRITPLRADSLLLGGFIALALRGPEIDWIKRLARPIFYLGIFAFGSFEVLHKLLTHRVYDVDPSGPFLSTLGLTLIDLFAASVLLLSLNPAGRIARAFSVRPLRWLGQISYGFYVFHDIPHRGYEILVAHVVHGTAHRSIYVAAVALVGTLVLSFLSFRLFEVPFLRLKDHFTA